MIVILSFSYYEQGTDPVIDWLLYYKVPFVKICVEDLLTKSHEYNLDVNTGRLSIAGTDITDKIKVIFFRRFYRYLQFENKETLGEISRKIFYESNEELNGLTQFLYKIFEEKIWFPRPEVVNVNKLTITYIASKLGIKTPKSAIINNKNDVVKFHNSCSQGIINKPIGRLSYYTFGRYTYNTYTTKYTEEKIEKLQNSFFPSLFQEAVISQYEVRVFYIDGDFYATAAVSSNKDRNIDIKRSFNTKELRWIPYALPESVKLDITKLMKEIDLVTGSIDLLVDDENNFTFIEVNPVGQYLAPSNQSNYYIDKIIAEWLIKKLQLA
ncbi:RimK-like ATP-grasp domain-containing protein [Mucilaginibacter gossypiicola]|uniref:RimK-like ATP-grasp domain-containing protein n=1 Tax=Mucilaginibacter gossypiicola TaxID=551995 RepID=A0A1H8TL53_9SPHI|nr:hypothetical protein [Mucilaginibacter gossypiicola]SEO91597.1 RimK-like ATP-grasp domain-containing protein [Mucilaginibacter gossypiicola]